MNDIEKLRQLLPHWLEHNAEHASEFLKWANRARATGEDRLAHHLEAAAKKLEAAKHDLARAIEQGGQAEDSCHR
ncbi:MAG: hypothetical protein L3J18_04715 [Candidatus Brocadia sp.]|uniref:DUF8180 domain-containing protein n=1 Tax=Candidatus Brocadia fulgida TaxID=380242 RepID=A0A0M2URS4_9BACT|nr:MAG: hypothetical protein BROFUL_02735 [Candidatus Brocadia fulgida]UJS21611.1 MAG: hypothetical protein L3J18_04715 [Candidatus Brocadia sp.]